ncbi:MAG: chromosomal replication initiator protein DnaA [Acidobacteria bacterium]|nr:chromosomal replication initiator protein DnaA [Acidobacteriota bacterium]
MSAASIWTQILALIETKVGPHSFSTWFKPTSLKADEGRRLIVRVPAPLYAEWLPRHYSVVMAEAMAEVGRANVPLVFEVEAAAAPPPPQHLERAASPELTPVPMREAHVPIAPSAWPTEDAAPVESVAPAPIINTPAAIIPGGLNPRYTFDTFIVGPSNQFAHAACRAVAEAPSRSYNPLFIYGGVGLGKTHLMHAIGQYVLQHNANLTLTYISSERFMNEMINALRFDRILEFRARYRSVDVLLVDDIQFVSGKEGTQTEFFHTFNALHDAQKQIVISSDRPPHEITQLEERLRSRFEWGLIADIQSPDIETKTAILKKKAETEAVPLPDNVAIYIASRIKSNIRELEGSLIRLLAYASLTGRPLTIELAQDVLRNVLDHDERAVTIEQIQRFVADYYQLKLGDLKSRNNAKSVSMPRQVAMYLAKMLTHASLPEIGRSFGGKHHSTVIHSIKKVEELRKTNPEFNIQVGNFLESFK